MGFRLGGWLRGAAVLRAFEVVLLSLLATSAVAGGRALLPEPIRGQKVVWQSGLPFTVSRAANTTVALSPSDVGRMRASLTVTVNNHGASSATVSESSILAQAQDGSRLRLYGAADLEKREKRRRFWQDVGAGALVLADAYGASLQTGQTTTTTSST
jgi:hypothetical protein